MKLPAEHESKPIPAAAEAHYVLCRYEHVAKLEHVGLLSLRERYERKQTPRDPCSAEQTISGAPDREILRAVGRRLEALRRDRGLTQTEAARRAGLGRNTLYRAEQGRNPTLLTVIRLLRVYGRLSALEDFIPEPELSPMARLRERRESGRGESAGG